MSAISAALQATYPSLVEAHGGHFVLADGKRLVDMSAQTLNLALGQGAPEIVKAVVENAGAMQFASSRFGSVPFMELSERLAKLAPDGIETVILKLTNGSDAVETAIKLAMSHTRRSRIGCLPGAWHGESFFTLSMATTHRGRVIADSPRVAIADENGIPALARLVRTRPDLAAVVLDPAMVSAGLHVGNLSDELAELRRACDDAGTLLVYDEIQTFGGFLGPHLFVTDMTGVCPDLICLGKALGAGYPLAATLCRDELAAVLQYNDAEYTYGGHPISCAAGLAALSIFEELRQSLSGRVAAWRDMLTQIFPPDIFELRQFGLMASLTSADVRLREAWAQHVVIESINRGIYVRPTDLGRRILLKPPLVLTPEELNSALAQVRAAALYTRATMKKIKSLDSAQNSKMKSSPWVVRKALRPNPHAGYVDSLLQTFSPGLHSAIRSPRQQEQLTRRLAQNGVSSVSLYAAPGVDALDYGYVEGKTLHEVLASEETPVRLLNGLALRHYELVTLAHDSGVVIGDRWPGNAIVCGTAGHELKLIDFDLAYEGSWLDAALFEEAFCILQTLASIPSMRPVRLDLLRRLVASLATRHGPEMARQALTKLAAFYSSAARPVHEQSAPAETYSALLNSAIRQAQYPRGYT